MKRFLIGISLSLFAVPAFASVQDLWSPEMERQYLQQIDSAVQDGRLTQAKQMLVTIKRRNDPVFPDDIALLDAELAIMHMDVSAASAALSQIEDNTRNLCRFNTAMGWVFANDRAHEKAIVALKMAAENCPEDAGIWNLLGLAYMQAGDGLAASHAFGNAKTLGPDNAQIVNNHALAALQNGQMQAALQELDEATALNASDQLIKANRNFVAGMVGQSPERTNDENDAEWSAKLVQFAKGAKSAARGPEALALFSRAMLTLEQFDKDVWLEVKPATGEHP